ncbi:hypothetical protein R3P38DRAFT_3356041 [Favolaschia claudopus]|uniref:DNA-directed RNA polymerase n=1 Tax=Favolaschia claudopus TaxID=2862362 RepID=A0AAW0BER9_9AGAR
MERFLQFQVATYIGTEFPNAKNGASISARLNGKDGRIRRNLVTKPVDFCARTVVTGDPNIELDEVGVPRSIAMNLTYPERVTLHNLSYLQALVRNGPDRYPGARFVIRDTGERLDLRHDGCALQYGWTVERHLRDGDSYDDPRSQSDAIFHVPAYNIKFDGDEMNLQQVISPRHAKPIMGLTEDTLVGVRRFTLRDMFLDWAHVQNILLCISDWDGRVPMPAIVKPKPLWTGKQILSLMIPCGIHVFRQPDYYFRQVDFNLLDDGMLIKNGDIIYGTVDKRSVGAPGGSLIDIIFRERGPEAAGQFLTDLQLVVNYWLFHHGFSVGIGDAIVPSDTASFCVQRLTSDKQDVEKLIDDAAHDRLRAAPSLTLRETFEVQMNFILARARDYQGSYAWKAMQMQNNNISTMINAGSSGSFLNFTQMTVCVGQQLIERRRIPFGFQHRTLPHFARDDFGAKARGFVENSYFRGLAPHEFFFHAMAARGDLVNTSDEAAEIGYIHRGLARALRDLTVCYDGTVRNSRGDVIQLLYGEDGMDESCVGMAVVETFASSDTAFQRTYTFDVSRLATPDPFEDAREILTEEYAQLTQDRQLTRSFIYPHFDWIQRHRHRYLPVDIRHLIDTACDMGEIDHQTKSDLTPGHIIHSVKNLCQRLVVLRGEDPIGEEARRNAVLWFQIQLRSALSAQQVINDYHFSREALDWVLRQVESGFKRALVHAGEMCGMVAAQSIGGAIAELSRDFTPDWRPGASSSNIKAGKPGITRLKEILSATRRIKYPSLTIYLDRETGGDSRRAGLVANKIEYISFRDIVSAIEIWYDPDPATTLIEQDEEFVEDFFAIPDEEVEMSLHLHSPWLLRFELNRRKMVGSLSMAEVAARIADSDRPKLFCIWNEDNADKLTIRCRMVRQDGLPHEGPDFLGLFADQLLDSVVLRGVRDINKVLMLQQNKIVVGEDGNIGWNSRQEWVLETHGSNLKTVMSIDGVDWRRTYSNSCVEIFQVLGIEAARAALLKEIRHVLEWDGSYVGYRHLTVGRDPTWAKFYPTQPEYAEPTRHKSTHPDAGVFGTIRAIRFDVRQCCAVSGTHMTGYLRKLMSFRTFSAPVIVPLANVDRSSVNSGLVFYTA